MACTEWSRDSGSNPADGCPDYCTGLTNTQLHDNGAGCTGQVVLTHGDVSYGDERGGAWHWDASQDKSLANYGTIIDPVANYTVAAQGTEVGTGCWVRDFRGPVEVIWFDPTIDGAADDYASINAALTFAAAENKSVLFSEEGIYLTNTGLVPTVSVNMVKGAWLKYGGAQDGICVDTATDEVELNVNVDMNGASATGVRFTGDGCSFSSIYVKGIRAQSGGGSSVYGLAVQGDDLVGGKFVLEDSINTSHTNQSFPQGLIFNLTANHNYIETYHATDVQSALVHYTSTTEHINHIGAVKVENAADNGMYFLDGTLLVDDFSYNGSEECFVTTGGVLQISKATIRTSSTNAIRFSGCDEVNIGHLHVLEYEKPGNISGLRTDGGTPNGRISIGRLTGGLRGSTFIYFHAASGNVEYFSLQNVDLVWYHNDDAVVKPAESQWWNMTGCKGFSVQDCNIRIIDETATGLSAYECDAPVDALKYDSYWKDVNINFRLEDGAKTQRSFIASGFAKGNIYVSGAVWNNQQLRESDCFDSSSPKIRGGMPNSIDATPTIGSWRAGTDLSKNPATSAPFRIRCTVSGTFGTLAAETVAQNAASGDTELVLTTGGFVSPGEFIEINLIAGVYLVTGVDNATKTITIDPPLQGGLAAPKTVTWKNPTFVSY